MEKDNDGDIGGIGVGGGKGKNIRKLDAAHRRKEAKKTNQNGEKAEPAIGFPIPEDYGDGSHIRFTWMRTHRHLLHRVIKQEKDDCWAWALVRILQFYYNMNITAVAEQKTLSTKQLVKYVILGRKEADANKKLDKKSLAVSSLKRAIDYIREIGIERDYGTKMYKIKANFHTKPDATPEYIRGLLLTQGPIGISVDVDKSFVELNNFKGIHVVHEPKAGMERHALIIIGYGYTQENTLFFIVQNTWGTSWGFNGYARIMIEETCPIFYCAGLV